MILCLKNAVENIIMFLTISLHVKQFFESENNENGKRNLMRILL